MDLDGVCCDFVGHVLNLCGKSEDDLLDEMSRDNNIHPYDALENCVGRKKFAFWSWIEIMGCEFWHTMPVFDWFEELYGGLNDIGDVHFLTSAPRMPSAYSGKSLWVERNVGKEAVSKLIICPAHTKYALAGPHRILIDDTERNVKEWRDTGNVCYYFPSLQFHKRHPTVRDIREAIDLAKETVSV